MASYQFAERTPDIPGQELASFAERVATPAEHALFCIFYKLPP
ncbi:hypothetical protein A2U01_0097086, partial [Trifolium medium]|nr:hypothetical protein [Trifolium medium]